MEVITQPKLSEQGYVKSMSEYKQMYQNSNDDPEGFWSKMAQDFYWKKEPSKKGFLKYNFDYKKGPINIKWMEDGKTNICYNALDRWIERGYGDRVAYHWNGNEPDETKTVTYGELKNLTCKFANVLLEKGIEKGDCIAIYMPVTIEMVATMLACARIGAVHMVVFAGFGAHALAERIMDSKCKGFVTANGVHRGTKFVQLQELATEALNICKEKGHHVKFCIMHSHVKHNKTQNGTTPEYLDWHTLVSEAKSSCDVVWTDAEDPLFVLYTSGSTGKPKGVVHTTGGYMVFSGIVFKYVYNYRVEDIFFCTADLGWITGHTHNVYGGLLNMATIVLLDGTPTYPNASRFWEIVDKFAVSIFYTAPTAVRSLMKYGDKFVKHTSRKSLKVLALVGEPIDPESWKWFHSVVGESRCTIIDTFFQTETAAPMIAPLPWCTPLKPGSATLPFFGVQPVIMDEDGKEIKGVGHGYLCFKAPWPGIARTILGQPDRFEMGYFRKFPGYYFTGDGCKRDKDGYFWITGRVDDKVNVSGHLLSTAEVEAVVMQIKCVAECAVVAAPHKVKGQCLWCYVILKNDSVCNDDFKMKVKTEVREQIGPLADPEMVIQLNSLPKTRSGKILRRILRKHAANDLNLGDVSSLAEDCNLKELRQ